MGEVGKPIFNILKDFYSVDAYDQAGMLGDLGKDFDVIHICFGHKENETEDFVKWVDEYQSKFLKEGGITIIHSTVALGLSLRCGAVHSPIRGMHFNMEKSIRTFVKFFGGSEASTAAEIFRRIGIKVMVVNDSNTTEAMKLFDTEYYRICVEFMKRVDNYCYEKGLNFHEVYTLPNISYNEGYQKLGYSEYTRPVLQPIRGEIGGHCLTPNSKLIKLSEVAT